MKHQRHFSLLQHFGERMFLAVLVLELEVGRLLADGETGLLRRGRLRRLNARRAGRNHKNQQREKKAPGSDRFHKEIGQLVTRPSNRKGRRLESIFCSRQFAIG